MFRQTPQPVSQPTAANRSRASLAHALCLLCGLMPALPAAAGPMLTPIPADGALRGSSGQEVGWGFVLSNDTDYLVVTSASFPASLTIGTFTDYISAQFLVVGPTPERDSVTQAFDPVAMTGLGAFLIDRFAPIGGLATGLLTLTYDLYSRSPNDLLWDPDQDGLSFGNELSVEVSVGVPAPASMLLVLTGLLGLVRWHRSDLLHASRPR